MWLYEFTRIAATVHRPQPGICHFIWHNLLVLCCQSVPNTWRLLWTTQARFASLIGTGHLVRRTYPLNKGKDEAAWSVAQRRTQSPYRGDSFGTSDLPRNWGGYPSRYRLACSAASQARACYFTGWRKGFARASRHPPLPTHISKGPPSGPPKQRSGAAAAMAG
jgi:hypothetical protein